MKLLELQSGYISRSASINVEGILCSLFSMPSNFVDYLLEKSLGASGIKWSSIIYIGN